MAADYTDNDTHEASHAENESIDFDSNIDDSFLFGAIEKDSISDVLGEKNILPHTEVVNGYLQVFVGNKQITFDEAHHITPRLNNDYSIEWDISATIGDNQPDDIWEEIASVNISTFVKQMKDAGIKSERIENGYSFEIPLSANRKQIVCITESRSDIDGDSILQILTRCGDSSKISLETLLRMNMEIPYGAFAITEIDGKPFIVLVDTQLEKSAQVDELRKSMFTLAKYGNDIEKMLHNEDKY